MSLKTKLANNKLALIGDLLFGGFLLYISYRVIFFTSKLEYFLSYQSGIAVDMRFYYFNLIFHELFHLLFSWMGEFMHFLGGTLGEFVFPIIFLLAFIKHLNNKGIIFCIWWMGFNIVTTGVYMQDAVEQKMPMLFEGAQHDWVYLFGRLNVLDHAQVIGDWFVVLGEVVVVGSCLSFLVYFIKKFI